MTGLLFYHGSDPLDVYRSCDAMKVFVVAHKIATGGGQENVTKKIVIKTLQIGLKVHVICVSTDLQSTPNLRVTKIPIPTKPASLSFPLFILSTSCLLLFLKRRSDVSYSCGFTSLWKIDYLGIHFCMQAYQALKVPRQVYKSSLFRRFNMKVDGGIHLFLENLIPKRFKGTYLPISIGLANDIKKHWGVPSNRIHIIPNGTYLEGSNLSAKRSCESLSSKRLLFLGGDWGRKGLIKVIESLRYVDDWTLEVVGKGLSDNYKHLLTSWGLADRITFHGHRENVFDFIQDAQFLILPSYYEGLPISLLESITCGTPIIYTKINGSHEIFERWTPGVLLENNNMETLIQTLSHNYREEEMQNMHLDALKVALEMNFEYSLQEYIKLFIGKI